jgi:phage gpG-like protein
MPVHHSGKSIFQIQHEFNQFQRTLPNLIGAEAVNFFKFSFRRQGFVDKGGNKKWEKRKQSGGKNAGRAILTQSGRLRRSIRVVAKGFGFVKVGTDVPYAQIHNEGGTIQKAVSVRAHERHVHRGDTIEEEYTTKKGKKKKRTIKLQRVEKVRAHTRQMNTTIPQRQFIGESEFLTKRLTSKIEEKLKNIFL